MKKTLLILSIITILFLVGCNSTENNNTVLENQNNQQQESSNINQETSNTQQQEDSNITPQYNYYIYKDSSTKLIQDNLEYKTLEHLELAKNEIFARYGHDFSSEMLKNYFNNQRWYNKIEGKKVSVSELNEIERKNVEYIDSLINAKLDKVFNQEATQTFDTNITLYNTYVDDLFELNNIDYKNLAIGEYKYVLGKTDVFGETCDIIFTFNVDSIDEEFGYRMYGNQQFYLVSNDKIKFNSCDYDSTSSSDFYAGMFTKYNNYLLFEYGHISDFSDITLYAPNGTNVFSTSALSSKITIDNNKIFLSSYDKPAGYVEGAIGEFNYYRVDYEIIEKDGKFEQEELKVDYEDIFFTAQT